jgi:hypothetical protein
MRQVLAASLIAGAIVFVGGLARAQQHNHNHAGQGVAPPDTRVLVKFPPELAEHTLTNMRDHLLALEEINAAMAKGQFDEAAKIAEARLGMSSLGLHGASDVAPFMPQGMQDAGTGMHRAASRFAIEAQNASVTGDLRPAFGALADVMSGCNGCHAGYRLR